MTQSTGGRSMVRSGRTAYLVGTGILLAGGIAAWMRNEARSTTGAITVFSESVSGCPIVVPRDAVPAERAAAELLQSTLAKASGRAASHFPIFSEGTAGPPRAIYIGGARRSDRFLRGLHPPLYDNAVGVSVMGGMITIKAERREAAESAVAWF